MNGWGKMEEKKRKENKGRGEKRRKNGRKNYYYYYYFYSGSLYPVHLNFCFHLDSSPLLLTCLLHTE
uniref:Uncharacterized protein n=1 Tax=Caenorhabditis japonica TaxID=281687 RepID=A0A8R1IBC9_CAEJA